MLLHEQINVVSNDGVKPSARAHNTNDAKKKSMEYWDHIIY